MVRLFYWEHNLRIYDAILHQVIWYLLVIILELSSLYLQIFYDFKLLFLGYLVAEMYAERKLELAIQILG